MFLERYVDQRRQIERGIIEDPIAFGELKPTTTDPELLIDLLSGPLFFRWLQGHAPLDKRFAKNISDKVIPAFQTKRFGCERYRETRSRFRKLRRSPRKRQVLAS
jgi:hypothetical protein